MITDVFHKRYPHIGYSSGGVPREIHVLFRQGAQILFQDLKPHVSNFEAICHKAYDKLVREIGHGLYEGRSAEEICSGALCETYDLWNNAHGNSRLFTLYRLSLLELLLSEIENELVMLDAPKQPEKFSFFSKSQKANCSAKDKAFREGIIELNHRFREAGLPFHYHNGIFQLSNDDIVERQIYEPFWSIVKDPKFKNVDIDMKEALDRRDSNDKDPALFAAKALESAIKIVSDKKGWTKGSESGSSHYVDNLVSKANGRFLSTWESDMLRDYFRKVRNSLGHGPGSDPMPVLSIPQTDWAIETAMSWVRTIIRRL